MKDSRKAVVIQINGKRFFRGISPTGRLQTADSLVGAKLFGEREGNAIWATLIELCKRGKKPERQIVRLVVEPLTPEYRARRHFTGDPPGVTVMPGVTGGE